MLKLVLVVALLVIQLVVASPAIGLPLNSQVPPVAHVSQFFDFTFSPSTFTDTAGSVSYALSGAPSWLSLSGSNRTLSGTPGSQDAGSTTFQLTATDGSGSTSMPVTLVVLSNPGPQLGASVLPQLEKVGAVSTPASLLLHPAQSFTLQFDADTFTSTSSSTIYYATSGNNTPLPNWLQFNGQNLAFSGTTPPLVSPTSYPQIYPIRLVASDVIGFADATVAFQIVVGYDVLNFNVTYQTVTIQQGQYFQSPSLSDQLLLNGQPVPSDSLVSITSDAPNWLTLHAQNLSLSGQVPNNAESQNITVTVTDSDGDVANTTMSLLVSNISDALFTGDFSTVNATVGEPFSYTLGDTVASGDGISITVYLGTAGSWLSYDPTEKTLSGTVPTNNPPLGVENIEVKVESGTASETKTLPIDVIRKATASSAIASGNNPRATSPATSSATQSSSSPTSTSPSTIGVNDRNNSHKGRNLAIVLGILLPLILLLLLLLLILFCLRRRKKEQEKKSIANKEISRPFQTGQESAFAGSMGGHNVMEEKRSTKTPDEAPQIEPLWAVDSLRRSRLRFSKQRKSLRGSPLIDPDFGDAVRRSPPMIPPKSPKRNSKRSSKTSSRSAKRLTQTMQDMSPFGRRSSTLNYSRKRTPFGATQSRTTRDGPAGKRTSRSMSPLPSLNSELPTRLSGMGHGNGGLGLGPPGYMRIRESWHNPHGSVVSENENERLNSVDLETFPYPPERHSEASTPRGSERTGRASVRLVHSPTAQCSIISEGRQRYIRQRAIDRMENTPRWPTWAKPLPSRDSRSVSRGLGSQMRSPALSSSIYAMDDSNNRDTWQTYSKASSVGGPRRPETIVSEDEISFEMPRRPPPLRLKNEMSFSSGQFDTAASSSEDNWEIEELEEAYGQDGQRRWQLSASNSPMGSPLERPLDFGEGGLARLTAANRPRPYTPPTAMGSYERKFALGERRGKRPISVTEGILQRSHGSVSGNLAFV